MDFIQSKPSVPKYGSMMLWRALKTVLPNDDGVCYYQYPLFSVDKSRQIPDILLLHRQLGLYIIECKPWRISDIENIDESVWFLKYKGVDTAETPYLQMEDQLQSVLSKFMTERDLRRGRSENVICGHLFLALPFIHQSEWKERNFDTFFSNTPTIIFADDLRPEVFKNCLQQIPEEEKQKTLSDTQWALALGILNGSPVLRREPRPQTQQLETKAAFLRRVEEQIQMIDTEQHKMAMQIPDGPQRIRGIAGSGKTVVMCMKAAIMHLTHPDWHIAYTFYSRSLHSQIKNLITRFYHYWSDDSEQLEPDWSKLRVLHAWGGRDMSGLYSLTAEQLKIEPRTFSEAKNTFHHQDSSELLGNCCRELLNNVKKIHRTYDAILVDEGQDFHFDFYKLCYSILKEPRRLIWAYDEVQSLENLSIPTTMDIFGTHSDGTSIVDLDGTYEGDIDKDLILYRCYRTPRPILIAAHMFGMGLQRSLGAVQFIFSSGGWEDIGYEFVEGKLEPGEEVTIRRPKKNSPHLLEDLEGYKNLVKWQAFDERSQELDWIAQQIHHNVSHDKLKPEEIVVISLDWKHITSDFDNLSKKLERLDIQAYITGKSSEKEIFCVTGKITLTNIFRAKGNEAPIIYVMGFDQVDNNQKMIVQDRNQAFTAMTRARGWCILTGIGLKAKALFTEIEKIVMSDPEKITFTVPDHKTIQRNLDSLEYERLRKKRKKVKELADKLENELIGIKAKDPMLVAEIMQRFRNVENDNI
ncbi:ATP-binding domain-containing protein [Dictyobacter arantiisoli]|uniref:Uncharacterized protein n=1 Tax=Dictyobacter arantiisoli TaxID=2014874 RepID=A0A5A5TJK5_9CHLR|nr:nuclease-related domain-containing DEAD/DEAH box helicase [Dictyobacter arantiisoli]GCF11074.1 hypothetical protein KDI_46380 [Dictyobacter arantiisoli]